MVPSRLKELRIKHKKKQKDIAKMLGITRQGYGNYENGVTEPDHATLMKLADIFDTSIDYLVGRTDDPSPISNAVNETREVYMSATLDNNEHEFIQKLREIAKEKGVELTDPDFLKLVEAAFDFAKRITEDQRQ